MNTDYVEYILDHYKNPRHYGTLEEPDISYEEGNPVCDDIIRFDLKIADDIIKDVKFTGKGCAISQAAASVLTDMVVDKDLDYVKNITQDDILGALGIKTTSVRLKCALLALKVLKTGVRYKKTCPRIRNS